MTVIDLFFNQTVGWQPELTCGAEETCVVPRPLILMGPPSWEGALSRAVSGAGFQGMFHPIYDEAAELLSTIAHHGGFSWDDFAWATMDAWPAHSDCWIRRWPVEQVPWVWVWGDVVATPTDREVLVSPHPAYFKSHPAYKKPFWQCVQKEIKMRITGKKSHERTD